MDSRRRITRTKLKPKVEFRCSCGAMRSPFARHTCSNAGDFQKRRRRYTAGQRRAREARGRKRRRLREDEGRARRRELERERRRNASAARQATPRKQRTRKPAPKTRAPYNPNTHRYDNCRDPDCERYPCRVYREGIENCPLSHSVGG
jgi:hypothetical protein